MEVNIQLYTSAVFPREENLLYPLDGWLGRPQTRSGHCENEKILVFGKCDYNIKMNLESIYNGIVSTYSGYEVAAESYVHGSGHLCFVKFWIFFEYLSNR
jgi:hypothetical protein